MRPLRLREATWMALGVSREWGLPSGSYVGRTFPTRSNYTAVCGLPKGRIHVRWERRRVEIVGNEDPEWVPKTWTLAAKRGGGKTWRHVRRSS
jgi:hypothetical protein